MANTMRWIHHRPDGGVTRGEGTPPDVEGVLHIYGTTVSESMRLDTATKRLYVAGKRAKPGTYRAPFRDGVLPIVVSAQGKATRRPIEIPTPPKGGAGGA